MLHCFFFFNLQVWQKGRELFDALTQEMEERLRRVRDDERDEKVDQSRQFGLQAGQRNAIQLYSARKIENTEGGRSQIRNGGEYEYMEIGLPR
jgi:hypothetical protein